MDILAVSLQDVAYNVEDSSVINIVEQVFGDELVMALILINEENAIIYAKQKTEDGDIVLMKSIDEFPEELSSMTRRISKNGIYWGELLMAYRNSPQQIPAVKNGKDAGALALQGIQIIGRLDQVRRNLGSGFSLLDDRIESISGGVNSRLTNVDDRLDSVDQRIGSLSRQSDVTDHKIGLMIAKLHNAVLWLVGTVFVSTCIILFFLYRWIFSPAPLP